jgi:hypothetical protein
MSGRSVSFSRPDKSRLAAIAALAALVLFLVRDAVFGGQVFYERDIGMIWYSQIQAFFRSVVAGSWPVYTL